MTTMNKIRFAGNIVGWAHLGTATERRIHAAVSLHKLTSCRINPAFLLKRCAGFVAVSRYALVSFILAGLLVLTGAGCERQPAVQTAPPPEPAVTFKPQEMADALHAVIAADHDTYARLVLQNYPPGGTPGQDENLMALHARMLRQASESVQQQGAEFHYVLRSLWPINPKNAPETDTEKAGLQYVLDHPGTNYYGGESLGGRRYFTAVYAEVATVNACADCHNRNPASPKKDFKAGDVMGGLVVRVPLEF
jgi:hypothetical protein